MYVNAHLSENTVLVYAESESYTDALQRYWCGDCNMEFTAADSEQCPACGSTDVHKEH